MFLDCVLVLAMNLSARADFKEIVPTDETEVVESAKVPTEEALAVAEEARIADGEALRKCAKSYDYSMKKRTLDLRLQQAKLKHDKAIAASAALFARNEALGKERRAETQKELDAVMKELAKLESGCTGRPLPDDAAAASAAAGPAGKDGPKDAAPDKKK